MAGTSSAGVSGVRGGDPGAGRDLRALALQALLQRPEDLEYNPGPCVVAHQADAPGLAFALTEPATDLDAERVEQLLADRRVVHAGGNADRVELRQLVPLGRGVG